MDTEARSRLYGLVEPTIFHEFKPAAYEHPFTSASKGGLVIATKLAGRGSSKLPTNEVSATYPYGLSAASGASGGENAALDYGDGSFWKVTFGPSVGSFNDNYATLAVFPDQRRQFRVFCALIEPEADCEIGFIMSVGGQALTAFYVLKANTRYRMVFAGQAPMAAANSLLRMFPLNASEPVINALPLWQSQHKTYREQLKVIEMLVDGLI